MQRDIQRRDVLPVDASEIRNAKIGEGDIIAKHEGKEIVVVLHIEAASQLLGHLIDEAEYAVILAIAMMIGWRKNPQSSAHFTIYLQLAFLSLGILNKHLQMVV